MRVFNYSKHPGLKEFSEEKAISAKAESEDSDESDQSDE